jgi:hypothetical protein
MDPYEDINLKNDLVLVFEKSDRYKELMFVRAGNEWTVVWKTVKCIWEGKGTYNDHKKAYADLLGFADNTVFKVFISDRGNISVSYYIKNGNHLKKLESRLVSENGKYFNEYYLNKKWVKDT